MQYYACQDRISFFFFFFCWALNWPHASARYTMPSICQVMQVVSQMPGLLSICAGREAFDDAFSAFSYEHSTSPGVRVLRWRLRTPVEVAGKVAKLAEVGSIMFWRGQGGNLNWRIDSGKGKSTVLYPWKFCEGLMSFKNEGGRWKSKISHFEGLDYR